MKLISWNVNGLRACMKKGFLDFVAAEKPDILCLQETKMQEGQAEVPLEDYFMYWCSAEKKGYSGTAVFSKEKPLKVSYGIGIEAHDHEGRVITADYKAFYLVCVYVPNAQEALKRLEYRMQWEDDFRAYVKKLDQTKPVILCGDLNVAHQAIDLKNPKSNQHSAGFSEEERAKMTELLRAGFVDSFRYLHPNLKDAYSWWSYRFRAREKNAGWRIDYFLVSSRAASNIKTASILNGVHGSDHCPVALEIEFDETEGAFHG